MPGQPPPQDRLYIETGKHARFAGEIAEDFSDRLGKAAHQCGYGEDLVAGGTLRSLRQVDDLDAILAGEVRLANALEIGESRERFRGLAGDIEPEFEGRGGSRGQM
jgi:hypothetical protein